MLINESVTVLKTIPAVVASSVLFSQIPLYNVSLPGTVIYKIASVIAIQYIPAPLQEIDFQLLYCGSKIGLASIDTNELLSIETNN